MIIHRQEKRKESKIMCSLYMSESESKSGHIPYGDIPVGSGRLVMVNWGWSFGSSRSGMVVWGWSVEGACPWV
jgi:hypothetical protein